jgi:hypothetical protein
MYAIFLTAHGKNYGCFAFDKSDLSNGEVRIAASFCSSEDRKQFSKKEARELAEENLSRDDSVYVLDCNETMFEMGDVDNKELADMYFARNLDFTLLSDLTDEYEFDKVVSVKSLSEDVPSWVAKAVKNRAVLFTLKNDNLNVQDLAYQLDQELHTNVLYSLFVDLKNATKDYKINVANSMLNVFSVSEELKRYFGDNGVEIPNFALSDTDHPMAVPALAADENRDDYLTEDNAS